MYRLCWLAILALTIISPLQTQAQSIATYPQDWRDWHLVGERIVPGNDVAMPSNTPLFLQETVRWVNEATSGQGINLAVYVHPDKVDEYFEKGPFTDGPTAVGVIHDLGVVFVTEHLLGDTIYGVYSSSGEDLSAANPAFTIPRCIECHSGNADICPGGTCTLGVMEAFGGYGD